MSEALTSSMRILFDMQACQTVGSAHRGVGRYSSSLVESIASRASPREIFSLTSDHLKYNYKPEAINPARLLNARRLPDWHTPRNFSGGDQDKLDGIKTILNTKDIVFRLLNQSVNDKDRRLQAEVRAEQAEVKAAQLYVMLDQVYHSRSWRMTASMRAIMACLSKLRCRT